MIPVDYLYDPITLDDLVKDGDRAVGDSTNQNQDIILRINKGELKQFLDVGVGIWSQIDNEDPSDLIREITKQYVKDGMKIKDSLIDENGIFKVDASY